jgi:hypothetical protein
MMLRSILFFFLLILSSSVEGQEKSIVTITGFAPAYVGSTIEVNQIDDYLTMKETRIASAEVKADSTFTVSMFLEETKKIVIRGKKNRSYLYAQPNGIYDIYFPDKDPYEPYRPNGNNVEVTFYGLDTADVNYKILSFLRWQDDFIGNYYYLKGSKPLEFAKKIDEFKVNAEKAYAYDSTNIFFKTYIRYSIAGLDNIQFAAERNRYEKHDFYLKNFPVSYQNDAYMNYFNSFYEKIIPRLSMETNNRVYLGVVKNSPTLVMRALGSEYTLVNTRIREIVMIKSLSEAFFTNDFPQTNILTILDSVANHSLFEANSVIARNMISRLTELVPGGKSPDFALKNQQGEMKTLANYRNKYLYIQFMDPSSLKSTLETDPLLKLHQQYKEDVTFITICPERMSEDAKNALAKLPWEIYITEETNPVFKNFKVETYPAYVLIDETGFIVAAPALSPMPNGQYETIDKTFYFIKEARAKLREMRR